MDWNEEVEQRLNGLNQLDEFRLKTYESSTSTKIDMFIWIIRRVQSSESTGKGQDLPRACGECL